MTTFNTPFGRYRWLRLPFGIKTAPEKYQRSTSEESMKAYKAVETSIRQRCAMALEGYTREIMEASETVDHKGTSVEVFRPQ